MDRRQRRACATANTSNTKYDLIRSIVEELGMVSLTDEESLTDSHLIWSDSAAPVTHERVRDLKRYQRINHFPGMEEVCRKDNLSRNMARMRRVSRSEYNFTPQTWILPSEFNSFVLHCENESASEHGSQTFIAKPVNGAMGNGIFLFRNPDRLLPLENMVVQNYLERPFLLDGYKIDLRLYVLITRCEPLRAFLYKDGLVRLGTEKYTAPSGRNMDSLFMHLTNYSVNKCHEKFQRHSNTDSGSKRSVKSLMKHLSAKGHDTNNLWRKIIDVVVKTLIVACPHISHNYRTCRPGDSASSDSVCFEVLGFDIFLDEKLNPWLLEINRTPSFGTDEPVDLKIKSGVLREALQLLNIQPSDKARSKAEEKAEAQRRLFRTSRQPLHGGKKDILKEKKEKVEKDAEREEHEYDVMKDYFRIFPSTEKALQKKYSALLQKAFNLFSHRTHVPHEPSAKQDREAYTSQRQRKHHRVRPHTYDVSLDQPDKVSMFYNHPVKSQGGFSDNSRIEPRYRSAVERPRQRYGSGGGVLLPQRGLPRIETLTEEQMTRRLLVALEDVRIKFPGKSDADARRILNRTLDFWDLHKSAVSTYWLTDLDSMKRLKVIGIVRDNIKPIVKRSYRTTEVDSLKLMRYFDRIFNRMCTDYGRGLWNCFGEDGESWKRVFSSEKLSHVEFECCQRVVDLCKDCLLTVYHFAREVKKIATTQQQLATPTLAGSDRYDKRRIYPTYSQLPQTIPGNSFLRGLLTQ